MKKEPAVFVIPADVVSMFDYWSSSVAKKKALFLATPVIGLID